MRKSAEKFTQKFDSMIKITKPLRDRKYTGAVKK